jgi:excisionase family DNA binding protein
MKKMDEQQTRSAEGPGTSGLDEAFTRLIRRVVKEELKSGSARSSMDEDDDLLTVEELAEKMKVSEDWVYDHASKLPFAKKLGPKMWRFSKSGLRKYMETRRY